MWNTHTPPSTMRPTGTWCIMIKPMLIKMVTVTMMPLAYSITTGIAAGFISYVICKLAARKTGELNIPTVALSVIFVLYFCLG